MTRRRLVPFYRIALWLPISEGTAHQARSKKRIHWLTRSGPDGHCGRILWVDVDELFNWARFRGYQLSLELIRRLELEAVPVLVLTEPTK